VSVRWTPPRLCMSSHFLLGNSRVTHSHFISSFDNVACCRANGNIRSDNHARTTSTAYRSATCSAVRNPTKYDNSKGRATASHRLVDSFAENRTRRFHQNRVAQSEQSVECSAARPTQRIQAVSKYAIATEYKRRHDRFWRQHEQSIGRSSSARHERRRGAHRAHMVDSQRVFGMQRDHGGHRFQARIS
jgi:hypothetical protein